MSQKEGKYDYFLKDEDLQRWLRNLSRGSPVTAEIAQRRLGKVCELLSTAPQKMLESARKDLKGFQDSLEDLVAKLEAEKKSPGYIIGLLKAVRSWLRYNDITLKRKIKILCSGQKSGQIIGQFLIQSTTLVTSFNLRK